MAFVIIHRAAEGKIVALPILDRICDKLDVDYGDIMQPIREEQHHG